MDEEEKQLLEDISDIVRAAIEKAVAPVHQRLMVLEAIVGDATKAEKRVRVPAATRRTNQ
ncbi:hypothetical protein [Mesorhizobium sp. M0187]|uniref:hypothetical protein n=1 Tax=Mesorhizobium sp. M0187 TaxID=2956908 RepID=UPI00333756E5